MSERLDQLQRIGGAPFELDFLRELGFSFGVDFDGSLEVEIPASVDVDRIAKLVARFEKGIRSRLEHERQVRMRICVGGPLNGQRVPSNDWYRPYLYHVGRGQWLVYGRKRREYDDHRFWFIGKATSERKARILWAQWWNGAPLDAATNDGE